MADKKILVTCALPYANGPIHIGHLIEYIQADVFVRFLRLLGKDVIYCCADDTHGTPIEINAKKQGLTPEQLIAKYYKEHTDDFKRFLIEFDSYYSTNSPENKHFSEQIFNALKDKGLIYTKDVENFYDEKEKRFLPDRYVKGKCPKCGAVDQYGDVCEKCNATYKPIDLIDPYSTVSGEPPIRKSSKHYFFKLSKLSKKLESWLKKNKKLQPEIVNYVHNWIKEGLQDWDISRDGPYFGFKIPGEADKYFYVWLDAPIGYIASTQNYCKKHKLDAEKEYWKSKNSEIIHFIGKDIIYFHFLFWPAMLMESGFNMPSNIVVHGFLTVNNEKMSKSRGTFLTAKDYLDKQLNPEFLRYYYTASLSHTMSDIDLDLKDFRSKINSELASNVSNFVYRVLSFCNKYFDSESGSFKSDGKDVKSYIKQIDAKIKNIKSDYLDYEFREAVKEILAISQLGNKYFQEKEPWKEIEKDKKAAHETISFCVNIVKNLVIVLKPILPEYCAKIEAQLNLKELTFKDIGFKLKNHKIGTAEIIIKKIEEEVKLGMEPTKHESEGVVKQQPQLDNFSKLNIKVAEIVEARAHPNAEKLVILQIELGTEKRQIVAGLKQYYEVNNLIGKHICVLTNLEHAKLRGEESQGMLLAGDDGKGSVVLLEAQKSEPGSQVYIDGAAPSDKTITFKEFLEVKIVVKDKKPQYNGKALKTDTEQITVDIADGAQVR